MDAEETKAHIRSLLRDKIADARRNGLWLRSKYQDIWLSPDKLEAENERGRFLWGPQNWELRDPHERLRELENAAARAVRAAESIRNKLEGDDAI